MSFQKKSSSDREFHYKNNARTGPRPVGRELFKERGLSPFAIEKYVSDRNSLSAREIASIEFQISTNELAKYQYDRLVKELTQHLC